MIVGRGTQEDRGEGGGAQQGRESSLVLLITHKRKNKEYSLLHKSPEISPCLTLYPTLVVSGTPKQVK